MKNRLLQAYKQAPWRVQMQWIGLFLLALALVTILAGVYLNINANAAAAGRNIQFLESDIDDLNDEIARLTTNLAKASSVERMSKRAQELGFKMIDPETAVYLEIPGYLPKDTLTLAPSRTTYIEETPLVLSSYKTSLWDWFVEHLWQIPSEAVTEGSAP